MYYRYENRRQMIAKDIVLALIGTIWFVIILYFMFKPMWDNPKYQNNYPTNTIVIKEEKIPVIFYIEFSDTTVADTICQATGAKMLLLHSCHNLTQEEFNSGVTYIELMQNNIKNLREALN